MIALTSFVGRILRALGFLRPPLAPVELSIPDQLVLRGLFFAKELTFDEVAGAVVGEWGATRLEVLASLRKLELMGLVRRRPAVTSEPGKDEAFRATDNAKEIAARIPVRPTVPMNLYI